jgi:hypothetical protein
MLAGSYGLGTQQVQIIAMDEPEPDGGLPNHRSEMSAPSAMNWFFVPTLLNLKNNQISPPSNEVSTINKLEV